MDLTQFLVAWRTTGLQDREVVDALVHPAHAGPSPELAAVLARWRGHYYWSDEPDGRHLILTRRHAAPRRERWWLHALLLLATLATTTLVGAVIAGTIPPPFEDRLAFIWRWPPGATLRDLVPGLGFSLPLLAILLAHELGHYVTARRYLLDVSPPYFLPMPLWPSPLIGTMGAFIRLRTLLSDRRQLFDVGIAGPIAGFIVALPILAFGLAWSHPLPHDVEVRGLVVYFGREPAIALGDSLVTAVLRRLVLGPAASLSIHPLAFAGWVGMFVTMLNLLPITQLDGGHVLFAVLAYALSVTIQLRHRRAEPLARVPSEQHLSAGK